MGSFDYITQVLDRAVEDAQPIEVKGRVIQVVGTIIKAAVPGVKVGEVCILRNPWEDFEVLAEVVGFTKEAVLLTSLGQMIGISAQTEVIPTRRIHMVPVGYSLLGRVLDGLGHPIEADEKGPIRPDAYYPVFADPPSPLHRRIISKPLSLGVRALDGLLTCGEGQRMGIFAAAGGGKSTLMAQIVRNTSADVTVLALIGERGREVREFIEKDLGPEGMRKSVVVCSTSDRSAMERLKAAYVATSIAEFFRDKGEKVLLLMDSVTRFGRAQREIGLAAGEPPTRRGFPPSVFSELPKLMERAGISDEGATTALYTVLVEGDDMTEPIADETRSILDGPLPERDHREGPQGGRRETARDSGEVRRGRAVAEDWRVPEGRGSLHGRGDREDRRGERVPSAGVAGEAVVRGDDFKVEAGGFVMAYALESMLRIRVMREDRAGKDLVAARHAREVAQVELDARKRKLSDYDRTKEERRDRVFDTILMRPVSRDEIDRVRSAVSQIDEEGVLLTDGVTRAKADLETREQEAEKAHGGFIAAVKERAKVSQHREIWAEEERRMQEMRADAEMEEFTGRKMTDDDSDDFD